jgi:hypothetical protein
MKAFLKLKNWHLFLLFIIPSYFVKNSLTMILIPTPMLALYSLWIYSIGIFGHKKRIEFDFKSEKTIYFKISCVIMPICWLITMLNRYHMLYLSPETILLRIINLIIGFGFLIAGLYMVFFVSKTLKTIELKSDPKFIHYVLIMLGFVFWPIGIWFIQPKVNKLFA